MKGIVVFQLANKKSKSEGVFPYLYIGDGDFLKIRLENDRSFDGAGLKPYDSKTVVVEGELNENNVFMISSIKEDCECCAQTELKAKDVEDAEPKAEAKTEEPVAEVIGEEVVAEEPKVVIKTEIVNVLKSEEVEKKDE